MKLPKLSFDNRKKNVTTNHMVFSSCDSDDGIQQQQQQIPTKDLDFVHIPKTGGSTIELAALHQAQKNGGILRGRGECPKEPNTMVTNMVLNL